MLRFILFLFIIMLGCHTIKAETYKATLECNIDSVFITFAVNGNFTNTAEFELGIDSIIVGLNPMKDANFVDKYSKNFFWFDSIIVDGRAFDAATIFGIPRDIDPANSDYGTIRLSDIVAEQIEGIAHYVFVIKPGIALSKDLTIGIKVKPQEVIIGCTYDTNQIEIFPVPTEVAPGYNWIIFGCNSTQTVTIAAKEGYSIEKITIDTNNFISLPNVTLNEDIIYDFNNVPVAVKSYTMDLEGYYDLDGIYQEKGYGGVKGYCLTVSSKVVGIAENFIHNLSVSPNPANTTITLTLDIQIAGNLIITLNDLLCNELDTIYNNFVDVGNFTKQFSTANLAKGVYYIKIIHNGDVEVEKIVVE